MVNAHTVAAETDLTYDGFYDAGQMKVGESLMPLPHYCRQPVNTRRSILYVNTGTLASVVANVLHFRDHLYETFAVTDDVVLALHLCCMLLFRLVLCNARY